MPRFFSSTTLSILVFSFLISSSVWGGETSLGVGISATEQGGTIYLPIRMPNLMIEPMFSYSSGETQNESEYDYVNQNDYSEYTIGLGVYLVKSFFSNTDLLVGLRGAYINIEQESRTDFLSTYYFQGSSTDADGFMIAPTVGVEYRFNDHVSAGIYTALEYVTLSGDSKSFDAEYGENHSDYERRIKSTATDLYVKYYF